MSRWMDQFDNHPFRNSWGTILETIETLSVADETVPTDVQELARLKKVVKYLNELLGGCDPELIPDATRSNFQAQSDACLEQLNQFDENKNIGHLTNANANLDNLLTYIRPYMVVSGTQLRRMDGMRFTQRLPAAESAITRKRLSFIKH